MIRGASDCQKKSKADWFEAELLQGEELGAEQNDWEEAEAVGGDRDASHVFPSAIGSTGVNHIKDNATKAMWADKLKRSDKFKSYLGCICDFMGSAGLRRIFVREVMIAAGGQRYAGLFDMESFSSIKTWRWGTVLNVFSWLLPLELALRQYWDPDAYRRVAGGRERLEDNENGHRGPAVDVDLLTEAIRSNWFWM